MTTVSTKPESFYDTCIKSSSKSETIARIVMGALFLFVGILIFHQMWQHSDLSYVAISIIMFAYVCVMTFFTWLFAGIAHVMMKYGK